MPCRQLGARLGCCTPPLQRSGPKPRVALPNLHRPSQIPSFFNSCKARGTVGAVQANVEAKQPERHLQYNLNLHLHQGIYTIKSTIVVVADSTNPEQLPIRNWPQQRKIEAFLLSLGC